MKSKTSSPAACLRRFAEPSEISSGVLFLLKNDYITGEILKSVEEPGSDRLRFQLKNAPKTFLAFTLIPLVEIYLLIKLGQNFGAITSILLVIFTGNLGGLSGQDGGVADFVPYPGETMREGDAARKITGCIADCHCRTGLITQDL